jgi:redox-sensitive bicupin YhaK (pirin superfamily)
MVHAVRHSAVAVTERMTPAAPRIALLANGRRHGPITRLITPWDIGERTHPFVLLNYAEATQRARPLFSMHPPSGLTTLAIVLSGALSFEDASRQRREVAAAGFAWMKAGSVAWHEGEESSREPLRVFQLWIAQLPVQPRGAAASEVIAPGDVEEDGPVRVILGQFGRASGRVRAPGVNCFHVSLKDGQRFCYVPPEGHNVTWIAVDRGGVQLPAGERVHWEQIALFGDRGGGVIDLQAEGTTSLLLGSAVR